MLWSDYKQTLGENISIEEMQSVESRLDEDGGGVDFASKVC